MRNLILALVALAGLAAAGFLMFGELGGDDADLTLAGAAAGPAPSDDGDRVEAPTPEPARLVGDVREVDHGAAAAPLGPRTLDGVLEDRFGHPVRGERVWLVDADQGHPPISAAFADYTTAMTSSSGKFSLTLPESEAFRLAVGPPGQPRVPVSRTRPNEGRPRARVVVPGGTSLQVTFDQMPSTDESLSLELVTLREGEADGGGRDRRDRGDRGEGGRGRGRGRGTGENSLDGPRTRGEDYDGASDDEGGGRRRGRGGDGQVSLETPSARLVGLVQDEERQRGGGRRQEGGGERPDGGDMTRGRGGFRNLSEEERERLREQFRQRMEDSGAGDEFELPNAPREVWRTASRHEITGAELESGVILITGVVPDRVARLDLRIGRRRVIEGIATFTVVPDVQLDIRVLPVDLSMEEPSLNYLVSSQPVGPTAPAIGIQWE